MMPTAPSTSAVCASRARAVFVTASSATAVEPSRLSLAVLAHGSAVSVSVAYSASTSSLRPSFSRVPPERGLKSRISPRFVRSTHLNQACCPRAALVGLKTPKVGMAHRTLATETRASLLPSCDLESSSGVGSASAILAAPSKSKVEVS
jgi:hypothetical protein